MNRMSPTPAAEAVRLGARFGAFVAERFPFALAPAAAAFKSAGGAGVARDEAAIERLRPGLRAALEHLDLGPSSGLDETTPGVAAGDRLAAARRELVEACDGFLRREAIAASLTAEERREILRGMVLTRATDNRLKSFFTGGEVRYGDAAFQGKGFRSLGQEAIYAAAVRLRRGPAHHDADGRWNGDVVAPVIRDLGVALAMRPGPAATCTSAISSGACCPRRRRSASAR